MISMNSIVRMAVSVAILFCQISVAESLGNKDVNSDTLCQSTSSTLTLEPIQLTESELGKYSQCETAYENITCEIVAGEHEAALIITLLSIAALTYILWEYGGIKKAVEKEATS